MINLIIRPIIVDATIQSALYQFGTIRLGLPGSYPAAFSPIMIEGAFVFPGYQAGHDRGVGNPQPLDPFDPQHGIKQRRPPDHSSGRCQPDDKPYLPGCGCRR